MQSREMNMTLKRILIDAGNASCVWAKPVYAIKGWVHADANTHMEPVFAPHPADLSNVPQLPGTQKQRGTR